MSVFYVKFFACFIIIILLLCCLLLLSLRSRYVMLLSKDTIASLFLSLLNFLRRHCHHHFRHAYPSVCRLGQCDASANSTRSSEVSPSCGKKRKIFKCRHLELFHNILLFLAGCPILPLLLLLSFFLSFFLLLLFFFFFFK